MGIVTVKGADWNGVMEAARKTFVVSDINLDELCDDLTGFNCI